VKRMSGELPSAPTKKNKYRKDKPWDSDDIDHWKVEEFTPEQYFFSRPWGGPSPSFPPRWR